MSKKEKPIIEQFHAHTRADWRTWLTQNHEIAAGVWCVTYKKAANLPTLTYDEMVEEALCFGWVDSKPNALDELRSMLYFSPRNPKSNWSRPNKIRIEQLEKQGLMFPAGQKMVDLAKKTGTWTALDDVENLVIPDDLAIELTKYETATQFFAAFPRSAKRGILEWIQTARTPETRQKRIAETARLAADNIRANQYSPKK